MKILKNLLLPIFLIVVAQPYMFAQNTYPYPSTGAIGIGTTSPDQILTLNAATGVNSLISFKQNAVTKAYVGLGTDGVFRTQTQANYELQLRADGATNFVSLYTNAVERVRVIASGNVGIAVTNPLTKLHVEGNIAAATTSLGGFVQLWNDNSIMWKYGNTNGRLRFGSATDLAAGGYSEKMCITDGGNVGIGTPSPGPYKLAVEGTMAARKIKVTQASPWADYVFENEYPLRSIKEVEEYINVNKHLPEVPTTAEVAKDGLDLGDNQVILLKKIEELTLYIIEQQKKLEQQEKRIVALEKISAK